MKSAYRVLAYLIAGGVFVQAAAIAWGVFTIANQVEGGAVITSDSELNAGQVLHGTVGVMVIPAIALILLIVSFFAKVPGGVRRAVAIFVLVVVQVTLAFVAFGAPIVGILHGANALAILGAAITAGSRVGPATQQATDPARTRASA